FFLMFPRPSRSTLFPYTTLFRSLLPDRDVDAEKVLPLLVDDGVDGDRGLAGLPVADDQLALTAPDRHHRIYRLEPRLHRLRHALDRKSTRLNSSHLGISYAVFCL